MAANLSKWLKYAQAKLNSAVSSSNAELDDLEAEQAARAADRPWLASDADAPTLDETRARIEWEAEEQRRRAEIAEAPASPGRAAPDAPGAVDDQPDPEVVRARIELDRQARESKERLEAIRKELGVDPPPSAS